MKRVQLPLFLGIKRSRFREDDPRRGRADAEFASKRPATLVRHRFECAGCAYESKQPGHLDVHHRDDDHHNNQDENLVPACHTCHPYQHVGEVARRTDVGGEGQGRVTLVASVPEISAADLNLLQRAIGMALLDENEAPIARRMIEVLAERAAWIKPEFGTFRPQDFAAAMAQLSDEEYAHRHEAIADLRLLFNEATLQKLGRQMREDYPSLPVAAWPEVAAGIGRKRQVE